MGVASARATKATRVTNVSGAPRDTSMIPMKRNSLVKVCLNSHSVFVVSSPYQCFP